MTTAPPNGPPFVADTEPPAASVRARLLKISKERHEDFTLMLMNYAAERFLYRLSRSNR